MLKGFRNTRAGGRAQDAEGSLTRAQEDARKMVLTMVEMERSYLTAEVFREILQQNGRSDQSGELIRTLSGRQVLPALLPCAEVPCIVDLARGMPFGTLACPAEGGEALFFAPSLQPLHVFVQRCNLSLWCSLQRKVP